jgi:hypothetical protein
VDSGRICGNEEEVGYRLKDGVDIKMEGVRA